MKHGESGSCLDQVLEEEEYEVWLKRQLLAESSIENREELLLESAQRLETNLNLLGTRSRHEVTPSASEKTARNASLCPSRMFRLHGDRRPAAGGRPRDHRGPSEGGDQSLGPHWRQTGDGRQRRQRLQTSACR